DAGGALRPGPESVRAPGRHGLRPAARRLAVPRRAVPGGAGPGGPGAEGVPRRSGANREPPRRGRRGNRPGAPPDPAAQAGGPHAPLHPVLLRPGPPALRDQASPGDARYLLALALTLEVPNPEKPSPLSDALADYAATDWPVEAALGWVAAAKEEKDKPAEGEP